MNIAEKMRRELEEQFSPEQVEEGLKRLAWIIRVRDCGEDSQTVLNELGIALSVHSYRKYKRKLDLYGIMLDTAEGPLLEIHAGGQSVCQRWSDRQNITTAHAVSRISPKYG